MWVAQATPLRIKCHESYHEEAWGWPWPRPISARSRHAYYLILSIAKLVGHCTARVWLTWATTRGNGELLVASFLLDLSHDRRKCSTSGFTAQLSYGWSPRLSNSPPQLYGYTKQAPPINYQPMCSVMVWLQTKRNVLPACDSVTSDGSLSS